MAKASAPSRGLPSTAPFRATTVSAAMISPSGPVLSAAARALRRDSSSTIPAGGSPGSTRSSTSGEMTWNPVIPTCSKSSLRRGEFDAKMISIVPPRYCRAGIGPTAGPPSPRFFIYSTSL